MFRFFVILASVLLLVGAPAGVEPVTLAEVAAETSDDGCHCCPDGDENGDEDGDCCDQDLGACCAPGMAAAIPASRARSSQHAAALPQSRAFLPIHLLRPRDNGPPPTPPPIG